MSINDVFQADSQSLAALVDSAVDEQGLWQPEELASIWRHQLTARLDFDLPTAIPSANATLSSVQSNQRRVPRTFGALLQNPDPPLELLKLTKDFAKARRREAEDRRNKPAASLKSQAELEWLLPEEIATVLYYAAIAAAILRCQVRITSLPDAGLLKGLKWGLTQPWLDDPTRQLFNETRETILA